MRWIKKKTPEQLYREYLIQKTWEKELEKIKVKWIMLGLHR